MSYVEDLLDDIWQINVDTTPKDVTDETKRAISDFFGVTIAGFQNPAAKPILRHIQMHSSSSGSSLLGTSMKVEAPMACLGNGYAAHVYDLDDCHQSTLGHPTAALAPAIVCAAEEANATGADVIRAYLIALEVIGRIGRVANPTTSERGWHCSPVFGVIGAATAASVLLGCDKATTAMAIGISCSYASGLRANFGTHVKALHMGAAAERGLEAAELARAGTTSSLTALEGTDGFFQVFAGIPPNSVRYEPSTNWELQDPGLMYKRFSCCSGMAPAIEAILEHPQLRESDPAEIESIHVGTSILSPMELVHPLPQTAMQSKFSMQYAIACPIVHRKTTLEVFNNDSYVQDERVQELMKKIYPAVDPELAERGMTADAPVKIRVDFRDGTAVETRRDYARGNPLNRLSDPEMREKFMGLCAPVLGTSGAAELYSSLTALESAANVRDLTDLC
jgi:2-methylcitrate dehydratase PrpD